MTSASSRQAPGDDTEENKLEDDRSRTPPSRRPRRSSSHRSRTRDARQREVVIERVVEKTVSAASYPMLTRTNYQEW